jgi:hypothetical protein
LPLKIMKFTINEKISPCLIHSITTLKSDALSPPPPSGTSASHFSRDIPSSLALLLSSPTLIIVRKVYYPARINRFIP